MAESARQRTQLTDRQCKAAKPGDRPYKLADGFGMYLFVTPSGHKSWRLKYRIGTTEKLLVLGTYPDMTLAMAREARDAARKLRREGIDPAAEKKAAANRIKLGVDPSTSFEVIAKRWLEITSPQWKDRHTADVQDSFTKSINPAIGAMAISSIRPTHIRALCQGVQERGAIETAHRIRQRVSAVFVYAIAHELAEIDPAASIRAALQPVIRRRQPALVKLDEAQAFLRAYEAEPGYPATKLASRLLALTAVRPGVIHMAEPGEFEGLDGPKPVWRIPAHKLKLERALAEVEAMEFIVPLSRQAVATVLAAMHFCLRRKYLFPSARHSHRPLTDNALNVAYRRVKGYEGKHVPHGWRSSFSTIMNERAVATGRAEDRSIIDLMLAHVQDGVEPLYNRAAYMDRRREIAQDWADLLITKDFIPPLDFLPTRRR
jgi:hypothetical protein